MFGRKQETRVGEAAAIPIGFVITMSNRSHSVKSTNSNR